MTNSFQISSNCRLPKGKAIIDNLVIIIVTAFKLKLKAGRGQR